MSRLTIPRRTSRTPWCGPDDCEPDCDRCDATCDQRGSRHAHAVREHSPYKPKANRKGVLEYVAPRPGTPPPRV